jgi:hypothetical protein
MNQPNQSRIRRITLPSGQQIEVHRFTRPEPDERDLHVCPSCESELVQPTNWSVSDDGDWALTLECPNCGLCESGVYGQTQVARLEDQLDEGLSDLIEDLQRLTLANMAADVDRFISALSRDLILPEDF